MRPTAYAEGFGRPARAPQRTALALSVCAMTRDGGSRLARVLALLRPLATEIVVAVDNRAPEAADALLGVADEVILFPQRDPADSIIPWLHAQCSQSWILNVDDDEVPSLRLLERLRDLVGCTDATHWWLPRRWLFGGVDTYLDAPPWVPDYQLRLYRNDPALVRFSDEFHRPVVATGPPGFAHDPLWHLDCIVNSFERRRTKADEYEQARRGMRVAGVAHNTGFYVPELLPDATTAAVPRADAQLLRRILDDRADDTGRPGSIRRAQRADIDALWPGAPFDPGMWRARLTRLHRLDRLPAGARHTVSIAVENHGTVTWPRGPDAAPLVQLGTRWLTADGAEVEPAIHTPLPLDLPPGGTIDVPAHLRAPRQPGSYRLSVDLVHEHVRWFGCAVEWPVEVPRARRWALIGRGAALESALDAVHARPEVEPIVLEPGARITPERFGNKRVPGLADYLLHGIAGRIGLSELASLSLRTARLLRRARRMRAGTPTTPLERGGEECLVGLRDCERLVIASADWEPGAAPTRHLWRLAATAAAARRLGLAVDASSADIAGTDMVDRLLARAIRGSNATATGSGAAARP